MNDISKNVHATLQELGIDLESNFVSELVDNFLPMCQRFMEVNKSHYDYLTKKPWPMEDLNDGSLLIIDLTDMQIQGNQIIIPLNFEPQGVKGLLYLIDPDDISKGIHDCLVIFITMKLSHCKIPDHIIQELHPTMIATLLALCKMDKQNMDVISLNNLLSRIHPDTICLTSCLPLSVILNHVG